MKLLALAVIIACTACTSARREVAPGDLVITHASVLDVVTGKVVPGRTVVVHDGIIASVAPDGDAAPAAATVIDAHGRLLTPAFVDAHLHTCNLYAPACTNPREVAPPLSMTPDSIASYRRTLASLYLPYGVTAVRDVGSDAHVMPMLLAWMQRSPDAPDYYPVAAHLVSPDPNHVPAPWQVVVADSAAAAAKVREWHALGIRNIKLYWRLHEPAFTGALRAAQELGMNVTAHVDFNVVTVDRALDLGLRNFEHMTAWAFADLTQPDVDRIYQDVGRRIGTGGSTYPGFFYLAVPEEWNKVGATNPKLLALVDRFKKADASITPTLHVFAQRLGLTYFTSPARDQSEDTSHWTAEDRARAIAGYRVMASYVKRLHEAGVRLNVGTDTPEPGKSVLSEMLLLHDAGISMPDVFRIATLESAQGIGHGAEYGSIEPGKRADLILFDGDPLHRPLDLLGGKTTIKDGRVYQPPCAAATALDARRLDSLFGALQGDTTRTIKGVVIARRGCTLAERYFNGDDANTLHDIRSATKSITSTLVGIAIARGLIKGVDEPLTGLLPPGMLAPEKGIRLRDVLTMRSGLDSDDRDSLAAGNENRMDASNDWTAFVRAVPAKGPPGDRYVYSSLSAFLAGIAVEQTAHRPLQDFAKEYLFAPLGIQRFQWRRGPHGEGVGQGNLSITARDMTAIGELFLRGGRVGGRQVVDSAWVRDALAPRVEIGRVDRFADGYGYMWYTKRYEIRGKPVTVQFASGNGGNKIYMLPAQDLVIAITSSAYGTSYGQRRSEQVLLGILDALR